MRNCPQIVTCSLVLCTLEIQMLEMYYGMYSTYYITPPLGSEVVSQNKTHYYPCNIWMFNSNGINKYYKKPNDNTGQVLLPNEFNSG